MFLEIKKKLRGCVRQEMREAEPRPSRGEGVPENQQQYKNVTKKPKRKEPTKESTFVFERWGDVLKHRRVQRLGVHCGIMKKRKEDGNAI